MPLFIPIGSGFDALSVTVQLQCTSTVFLNILYPTVPLSELDLMKEGPERYHTPHHCHAEPADCAYA